MNRKTKLILTFVLIMVITIGLSFLHLKKSNKEIFHNVVKISLEDEETVKRIVNIDSLSEDFMDDYIENVQALDAEDVNKRIIVISEKKEFDTYGASNIIPSPNNQYILEYSSESKKNKALEKLQNDEYILSAENDEIYYLYENTDDVNISSYMSWGIESSGLSNAAKVAESNDTEPIIAAIIDTGFNYNYVGDYEDRIIENLNLFDSKNMYDDNGHGTHVAGTIMEGTSSNVKIMPVKVSNSKELSTSYIIAAINYIAYNENADVINMSFGSNSSNTAMETAIIAAYNKNIISVCAAGNESLSEVSYPARYNSTIAISSVDQNLGFSSFSNYGKVDFTAPGGSIKSLNGVKSGTSMATPHAVAAISLLKSFNYNLSKEAAVDILKEHALDLGESGYDNKYGYGYIYFNEDSLCDLGEGCLYKDGEISHVSGISPAQETFKVVSNYGNETNILNAKVNVSYTDGKKVTFSLWELEDAIISGYDANSHTYQDVGVIYNGYSTSIHIDNTSNLALKYTTSDISGTNNVKLTGFTSSSAETIYKIIVPSEINGKIVTTIGDNLFKNATTVKYFVIPKSITSIGNSAFSGLSSLKDLKILGDNISVGDKAFQSCSGLTRIEGELDYIGEYAFASCSNLEEIHFSSSMTKIPRYAFSQDTKLNNVVLGENVTLIESNAFVKTTGLKNITLNENLETISLEAFMDSGITSIHIPASVKSVVSTAFKGAASLKTITVDPLNTVYDSRDNSNALIKTSTNELVHGALDTVIPSSVTTIGNNAFYGRGITSFVVPANVTKVGDNTFSYCSDLTKIAFLNNNISITSNAFVSHDTSLRFFVYKSSTAESYANSRSINVAYIDEIPFDYTAHINKLVYAVGESPDLIGSSVTLHFADPSIEDITYNYDPANKPYEGYCPTSFTFVDGDTYFLIDIHINGKKVTINIPVTVGYKEPNVVIPTGLTGVVGNTLSSVAITNNLNWIDDSQVIKHAGTRYFRAKYNPGKESGFAVKKVLVPVEVTKGTLVPEFASILKRFDGTTNLSADNISINNLRSDEYTVISAFLDKSTLGSATATITIKLSDEKFIDYSFSNELQEMTFTTPATISDNFIDYVVPVDKEYVYNGSIQEFEFEDFDSTKMTVSGNKQTNAGTYTVSVTPKSGYVWINGTSGAKTYTWKIERKIVTPEITIANKHYDGIEKISNTLVSVTNFASADYQILSASGDASIGVHTAKVMIVLLNNNYMFSNKSNTMEFDASFEVIRTKVTKPTPVDKTYTYTGSNVDFSLNNFDSSIFNITGNSQVDVGTYEVVVSIKDPLSYEWSDGTTSDLKFTFVINKMTLIPTFSVSSKTFDNKKDVDKSLISITNLDKDDYEIISATSTDLIGNTNLTVKVKLKDDVYKNISFAGNKQEESFTTTITINKKDINVTYDVLDDSLGYSGTNNSFRLDITGDDKDLVKVLYANENDKYILTSIPTYKEVGTYTIKFKIYINDDYYNPIYGSHDFNITSCSLNITVEGYKGLYDGKKHPIVFNADGEVEAFFAVGDYEYTKDIPEFTEIGTYQVNYKILSSVCDPIIGTKEVGIYGIKGIKNVVIKDNILVLNNNTFTNLKENTLAYGDNYSYNHLDKNNNVVDRDLIYTGDKYKISHPELGISEYLLSYPGDANGDGKISALDYVAIKNHIMGRIPIKDKVYFYGADATKDDKISALDYVRIKNYIMNGGM